MLLHVWLPLAHPAAPAPASAVLSGAMIKAALLGWLRFLPLGEEALGGWGHLLFLLGSITVIYGFLVGLVQTNPKVVLAYSSVSKMGLMTALLGLGLANPALAPALLTGLVLFAAHHGLAKGALFLGVGVAHASPARWVVPALAIPALVLAGAPFTSGALTKQLLEAPLQELQGAWAAAMPLLLTLASLAHDPADGALPDLDGETIETFSQCRFLDCSTLAAVARVDPQSAFLQPIRAAVDLCRLAPGGRCITGADVACLASPLGPAPARDHPGW